MYKYDQNTIDKISDLLIKQGKTIAAAESCTSGLIQNIFSQAKLATLFYQGGMTLYNLGQKAKHLNVNPITSESCNSVSKEIAEKMAIEVAVAFNAEFGIAITGYAQPVTKLSVNSCYAYVALAEGKKILLSKKIKGDSSKTLLENQVIFVNKTIDNIHTLLFTQ